MRATSKALLNGYGLCWVVLYEKKFGLFLVIVLVSKKVRESILYSFMRGTNIFYLYGVSPPL